MIRAFLSCLLFSVLTFLWSWNGSETWSAFCVATRKWDYIAPSTSSVGGGGGASSGDHFDFENVFSIIVRRSFMRCESRWHNGRQIDFGRRQCLSSNTHVTCALVVWAPISTRCNNHSLLSRLREQRSVHRSKRFAPLFCCVNPSTRADCETSTIYSKPSEWGRNL